MQATVLKIKASNGRYGATFSLQDNAEKSVIAIGLVQGAAPTFKEGESFIATKSSTGELRVNGTSIYLIGLDLGQDEADDWLSLPLHKWWDRYMHPHRYSRVIKLTEIVSVKQILKKTDILFHENEWWEIYKLPELQVRLKTSHSKTQIVEAIKQAEIKREVYKPCAYKGCTSIVHVPENTDITALHMHLALEFPGMLFTIEITSPNTHDVFCREVFVPQDSGASVFMEVGSTDENQGNIERIDVGVEALCSRVDSEVRSHLQRNNKV